MLEKNVLLDDTTILATNMKIEFSFGNITSTYTIIVTGDVNGDGKADFKDMIGINKHRLSKKMLNGAFLIGGDVTGDGKLNFKDIVKINKFRLKKINEL